MLVQAVPVSKLAGNPLTGVSSKSVLNLSTVASFSASNPKNSSFASSKTSGGNACVNLPACKIIPC